MTPESLGWAAGFFDGEGYAKVDGNRASLRIDCINPRALAKMHRMLGGSMYKLTAYSRRQVGERRPVYRWAAYGQNAIRIAGLLLGTGEVVIKHAELEAVRDHKKYPAGTAAGEALRERARKHRNASYT